MTIALHELTQAEKDELTAKAKADHEHFRKVSKEQDALWDRIFRILTPEEKADIPLLIMTLNDGGWSPATRDSAIKFIKDIIGENHGMRMHLARRFKKFWDDSPEIHF